MDASGDEIYSDGSANMVEEDWEEGTFVAYHSDIEELFAVDSDAID